MHQQSVGGDVVDVFAVDFEVVDHHRGASHRRDAGDLGEGAVELSEAFAALELTGDHEGLAVFAPDRVRVGHAERFGLAGDVEAQHVRGDVLHRAGHDHPAGAVVRFDLGAGVDADHAGFAVETHLGQDEIDFVAYGRAGLRDPRE